MIVWLVMLLLLVYPLSAGPVLRLSRATGFPSDTAIVQIYTPLGFLVDHFPSAGNFLGWYIFKLWGNSFDV